MSSSNGLSLLQKELMYLIALTLIGVAALTVVTGWPVWVPFILAMGGIIGVSLIKAFHLDSSTSSQVSGKP